ncbi:MAG: FkbM family methyltransferase [Parcubacteria group bacterium]|nr:FkbM family methyltransferase [Parcubacteria group bacterium]
MEAKNTKKNLLRTIFLRLYYESVRLRALLRMLREIHPLVKSGLLTTPFILKDGTVVHLRREYYDYLAFWENFCKREYEKYIPDGFTPEVILDLGAHKGFFSLAIARRFPEAHIYAVEPSSENFEVLVMNTRHLKNIHCIEAAIWKENGVVTLNTSSSSAVMHSVTRNEGTDGAQQVKAITMADLPKADIIKCDIEGAEHELSFTAPYVAFEVHENGGDLKDAVFSFTNKLRQDGYSKVIAEGPIVYALKA